MPVMLKGGKDPLAWLLSHKNACEMRRKLSYGLSWTLYLELRAEIEARQPDGMQCQKGLSG